MKKITILLVNLLLLISIVNAQNVIIKAEATAELEVCGSSESFEVVAINNSGNEMTNPEIIVSLPEGVEYITNSLNESTNLSLIENNVTQNNALSFTSSNIAVGDSVAFTIMYDAKNTTVLLQNTGAVLRNDVTVNYNTNSIATKTSNSYNILYPALSIASITPSYQTIASGESTTRTINVINGGNGKTDIIYIIDIPNSTKVSIDQVNIGTLQGDTIILSGSDFSTFGNGDNFLDQYETVSVTETLTGISCTDTTISSTVTALWGCNTSLETSNNTFANVTIDFQTPNLVLTTTETLESCFGAGEASEQTLKIKNTANGVAANVEVSIYKSTGGAYNQNIYSRFDETSLMYKIGTTGTLTPVADLVNTTTINTSDYACLGSNPIGQMDFTIPNVNPGEEIYITWNMYSCCIQTCQNDAVKGWRADVDYSDICDIVQYDTYKVGQIENEQYATMFTEAPVEIYNNQTEEFLFMMSSFQNTLPQGTGAHYKAVFTFDSDLVYSDLKLMSNTTEWVPSSINYDATANQVTALYTLPGAFTLTKSEFRLDLTGNCGTQGWKNANLDFSYVPDNSCNTGCDIPLACNVNVTSYLHCPTSGCNTLSVIDFNVKRQNFGSPDNDIDGLADASGVLDMTQVKDNRAMVGDSIQSSVLGVIGSSSDTWEYAKFSSSIEYGNVLDFVSADLEIYDASANTTIVVSNIPTASAVSSYTKTFDYDLSVASLSSLNSALVGFEFASGDSIALKANYYVASSVQSDLREVTFINDFYVSDFANPTNAQKEKCNFKYGRFTLIGYSFRNDWRNYATITNCTQTVQQNFGMSIGDRWSNYAGGNLFPYEYRSFGYLKEAYVIIPENYAHVSTRVQQYRTRRTNSSVTQTVNNVLPSSINGDTLFYNIEQLYTSGQLEYSDDGFSGRLLVDIAPNCQAAKNTYQDVIWAFNYQKTATIDGLESGDVFYAYADRVRFLEPNVSVVSENPWQNVLSKNVSWDFKVKNKSSYGASNAWVYLEVPTNIIIESVIDDATGLEIVKTGNLYQLGDLTGFETKDITINASFENCSNVSITAHSGYECSGYPTSLADFNCMYKSIDLMAEPLPSAFQTRISTVSMPDPCLPMIEVVIDITSVKLAHLYNMNIDFISPDTNKISIINGTSQFQYNTSNPYTTIADPSNTNGTYNFDINDYDASFAVDGIPGILDFTNNQFRLKTTLQLGSQFKPGDFIQIQINGQNACSAQLPEINLAYDPNSKFEKDNTSGIHLDINNSWSASWGDYDNDGFDDLFIPVNDITQPNILYHNEGDGTFTKITSGAIVTDLGTSISGSWGDYDNDGYIDLFVANNENSSNKLYHNNGDGTFTSIENNPIVDKGVYSHCAAWADFNKDGNLDLVVSDFHPTNFNVLFKGDGQGGFEEVTNSPISLSANSSVGLAWGDYDNDGDLDLFIANTNGQNNQLFKNVNGVFETVATGAIVNDGGYSVGGIWGDYDNDGDLDLFVTNTRDIEPNFFYDNNGDGTFTKITTGAVVENIGNSNGASWIDYDNDSDLDLIVANDQNQQNFLFSNNGDKTFTKLSNAITSDLNNSYGTSWSDYDNDGDYDLLIANTGSNENDFFINEKGSCTNHIIVKLQGCNSNSNGIGAMIKVKSTIGVESVWQTKDVSTQTSALGGQNSSKILFGLLDATSVDSVIIEWPSGIVTHITNPAINQLLTINEECGSKVCGVIYHDVNTNGIQDSAEIGIPNMELLVTPGNYQIFTDENGQYEFYLQDGTYTVEQVLTNSWSQNFPLANASYSLVVDLNTSANYCGNNFGNTSICTDPDLEITMGTTAFRRGLTNEFLVVVENAGAYDATDDVTIDLTFTDNTYLMGDAWDDVTELNGLRTYTYTVSNISALSDTILNLIDSVSATATLEELVTVSAQITYAQQECDVTNNSFNMTDIVVGSVDPNDKLVLVQSVGSTYQAGKDDTLVYKIRFQNLGNYAARRVQVVDELSRDLDWSTFEAKGSSHDFAVSLVNGVVTWTNNNIELPDSLSDPEGSNGYVMFSILPKQGMKAYSIIENDADIQFDYNDYIRTNNTEIQIITERSEEKTGVFVYPNPASSNTEILLVNENETTMIMKEISIYDISGNQVMFFELNEIRKKVNVSNLYSGIYIIRVKDEDNNYYNSKLIVAPTGNKRYN